MNEFENISSSLIPYDQGEIEKVMKQILYANGVTDVIYEGSNVSQISSVVSYVIATLNANTAMNLQETILPLASKRMNVLYGARQLGYEAHAIKSYKYDLLLKPLYDDTKTIILPDGTEVIDTNNKEDRHISIVHNTKFSCGPKNYYYVGPSLPNVITVSNFDIQYINNPELGRSKDDITVTIPIVEGIMTTQYEDEMLKFKVEEYTNENNQQITKQDYIIGYDNVEEDYGLQVYLTYIDSDGQYVIDEEWKKSEQFLIDENLLYNKRKFVRKENIILGYPTIFFKFAGLGQGVRTGTEVEVNVLQSSGFDGEALGNFIVEDVVLSEEVEIIDYELIEEGRSAETNEEIKDNAVVFKNTGNRAVTRYDYVTVAKRYPLIQEADAWGGEEESPVIMGNIWLSCTPAKHNRPVIEYDTGYKIDLGNPSHNIDNPVQKNWRNWYLLEEEYIELFDYLDAYKIMTMKLNYRHPLYINFDYMIDVVKYDISKDPKYINGLIFETLNNFFITNVEKYDSEYLNSNVQRVLDTALGYNTGVNFELKITGTLCEDMLDYNKKWYFNENKILVSLSWPYENIFDKKSGFIMTEYLPRIDGNFGYENGVLSVKYEEMDDQISYRKKATMYYTPGKHRPTDDSDNSWIAENAKAFGYYIADTEKYVIDLEFDFDKDVSIQEIFGPKDPNGGFRSYTEFPIRYYPFDKNLVNLAFAKNRMPRLRTVDFTTI